MDVNNTVIKSSFWCKLFNFQRNILIASILWGSAIWVFLLYLLGVASYNIKLPYIAVFYYMGVHAMLFVNQLMHYYIARYYLKLQSNISKLSIFAFIYDLTLFLYVPRIADYYLYIWVEGISSLVFCVVALFNMGYILNNYFKIRISERTQNYLLIFLLIVLSAIFLYNFVQYVS